MKAISWFVICVFLTLFGSMPSLATDYYVDATLGRDTNNGLTEAKAWMTIQKVNQTPLAPGDRVCFKRGEVWRESLIPQSGNEKAAITYTAYGSGNKPLFFGSISRNKESDWESLGENLWGTKVAVAQPQALPSKQWWFWNREDKAGGAKSKMDVDGDGSIKVTNLKSPVKNGEMSDIQLFATGIHLALGKIYQLQFRVKCTQSFRFPKVAFMKKNAPFTNYSEALNPTPLMNDSWNTYHLYFKCNFTDDDGRITLFLGSSQGIPEGAVFQMKDISLAEVQAGLILSDVGNIIFNDGQEFGNKIFPAFALDSSNQFWYDAQNLRVIIYSEKNPATRYQRIELALEKNVGFPSNKGVISMSGKENVVIDGLACKYSGAFGISAIDVRHITIRNCDISYIGGSIMPYTGRIYRYGNGIQFWGDAIDCLVENCAVWEIYDEGLTNQNEGKVKTQKDIIYRNNLIWNCERSFSFWNRPEASVNEHIVFENNVCLNAGNVWSHNQRLYFDPKVPGPHYNPSAYHVGLFANLAQTHQILIRNNLFYLGDFAEVYREKDWNDLDNLMLSQNFYYQPNRKWLICWGGKSFYPAQFEVYAKWVGNDAASTAKILTAVNGVFQPVVVKRTANSALIIWATESNCDSLVKYSSGKSAEFTSVNPAITKTHMVELTDLKPGAQYKCIISSRDLNGKEVAYPEPVSFGWSDSYSGLEIL